MTFPIKITFRDIDPSPAIEADIRKHAEKLGEFDDRIHWCNVSVEAEGKHQRKGRHYKIVINLGLPGKTITANRAGPRNEARSDIYVAIRDSFSAIGRQVEDHARVRRDEVKSHETPQSGRVVKIFPAEGYGFIETPSGEVYFHRNSVAGGEFDQLTPGQEVRFSEAVGDKGPQATLVRTV